MNKRLLLGVGAVGLVVLIVLFATKTKGPEGNGDVALIDSREIQLDPEVRDLVEKRIIVTESAIAAQEAVGEVDWDLYTVLGYDYETIGNLKRASEVYETYLALNPVNYVAWHQYGEVMHARGDLATAETAYRQVLSMTTVSDYILDLVDVIYEQDPNGERKDEIKSILELAVQSEGQTTTFMVYLGKWERRYGDCDRAIEYYENARTLAEGKDDLVKNIESDIAEIRAECAVK